MNKKVDEIIDSEENLIGDKDVPTNGANLETQANNTTDYNAKMSHQPYRYDMLGRFGFWMLYENEEGESNELLDQLAEFMYDNYMRILEHYYRNPNKLKSDYRKKSKSSFENDDKKEIDYEMAQEILEIIKPHLEDSLKSLDEDLKESKFTEGEVIKHKDKRGVIDKKDKKKSNDLIDKKAKKIADLINKLDKDKVKKIKNLLEDE